MHGTGHPCSPIASSSGTGQVLQISYPAAARSPKNAATRSSSSADPAGPGSRRSVAPFGGRITGSSRSAHDTSSQSRVRLPMRAAHVRYALAQFATARWRTSGSVVERSRASSIRGA
jgi:hypothetical protein